MNASSPPEARRKLRWSQWGMVIGAMLVGTAFFLAAFAGFITREDLTEVAGPIIDIEQAQYLDDVVLHVRLEGAAGRFKTEAGSPGFEAFSEAIDVGVPVTLFVEQASLTLEQPATIFAAESNGQILIDFEAAQAAYNREVWGVMLLGAGFWFVGLWIWHRRTRPLPTAEQKAATQRRLEELAERHPLLFIVVAVVDRVRRWGEEIPLFGDLFTAFLFFWILPLYMVFIAVTALSYRRAVLTFCLSYGVLLAGLMIAAAVVPNFPGADEYPALGRIGSRMFFAYLILNLTYGGVIWIWGTLMDEPEDSQDETTEAPTLAGTSDSEPSSSAA